MLSTTPGQRQQRATDAAASPHRATSGPESGSRGPWCPGNLWQVNEEEVSEQERVRLAKLERLRAGGSGIPAFYTLAGVGTQVCSGQCKITRG